MIINNLLNYIYNYQVFCSKNMKIIADIQQVEIPALKSNKTDFWLIKSL